MQRLLRTADWDVDGVRDDLRGYVLDRLGDSSGVWIVDLCRHRDYADRVWGDRRITWSGEWMRVARSA
jgi:hypothetical protein